MPVIECSIKKCDYVNNNFMIIDQELMFKWEYDTEGWIIKQYNKQIDGGAKLKLQTKKKEKKCGGCVSKALWISQD